MAHNSLAARGQIDPDHVDPQGPIFHSRRPRYRLRDEPELALLLRSNAGLGHGLHAIAEPA